ncbi:hypothetical protein GCM10008934_21040 [Virgibacillus salarius]|uniref:hypothetical protein n=1 Tax=Virgibacillus salarius TaxID=447199 RepID=UPI0031D9BDD4
MTTSKLSALINVINIVNDALDKGAYKSALFCALSISDICGQIEYPELDKQNCVGKRYKKWYNENIYPYEIPNHKEKFNERHDNKICETRVYRYEFF